jgi:hypothetical protein
MVRIGKRVDQGDGQGFDALLAQRLEVLAQLRLVEFPHQFAACTDALVGLDGESQRCHRQTLVVDHPATETTGNERPCDLQYLAVALAGDQADLRA